MFEKCAGELPVVLIIPVRRIKVRLIQSTLRWYKVKGK